MLCEVISGKFNQNIETSDSEYFSLDNLPNLSLGKIQKNKLNFVLLLIKIKIGYQLLISKMIKINMIIS